MKLLHIQDMSAKYDGRVLQFNVFVNSDEDPMIVLARIQKAARGPEQNAVMATAGEYTGDQGRQIWATLQKVAAAAAGSPKAKNVDEDLKLSEP